MHIGAEYFNLGFKPNSRRQVKVTLVYHRALTI